MLEAKTNQSNMVEFGMVDLKRALHRTMPLGTRLWLRRALGRERHYRFMETEETLLPIVVDPARESVDVGANKGRYTEKLALVSRHVYAFEPHPGYARLIEQRYLRDATVFNMALSDRAGQAKLKVPLTETGRELVNTASLEDGSYNRFAEIEVRTGCLDDLLGKDIGFIKIDVEGHEKEVLEGGRKLIGSSKPVVQVELIDDRRPGTMDWARRFFDEMGYLGFFVFQRQTHPIEDWSPEMTDVAELKRPVPRMDMDFVANFIFVPDAEHCEVLRVKIDLHLQGHVSRN